MHNIAVVERFNGQTQPAASIERLTRLRLAGPITAATSAGARQALRESAHRSDFNLLVDLQDVTALDASGVAALLDGRREIDGHAQGVMLIRANGLVIRALKQTRTVGAFDFCAG
jgi:anti-anti-sigma factor